MEIARAKFRQIVNLSLLHSLILILGSFVFLSFEAKADGYAECNQILVQDIFNRTTDNKSGNASEQAKSYAVILKMDEREAYKLYSKQHDEAKSRTEEGQGGGSFLGIIEAEGGGSVTNEKKLSENEFSEAFSKAKSKYENKTGSESSSREDMISNYASYVRDSATVDAWRDCVTKTEKTNIYAYASRDNAGKISVNVIWVPGVLAGSLPSIPIKFVTDGDADGVKIHADSEEQVAMGSGQSFAVSCGTKCDNGFQVTVNGALKNAAGIKTNSFTSTVEVPPLNLPIVEKLPPEENTLCATYARNAVRNYQSMRQHKECLITDNPRWQPNFKNHYQWCLTARPEWLESEREAREGHLMRCGVIN